VESVLGILFSAENVRMLVLLTFGFSGYVLLKTSLEKKIGGLDSKIDSVESKLEKKIDSVESRLEKKIDSVESRLEKRIESVESKLEKKIDSVESNLENMIHNVESSLLKTIDEKIAFANQSLYTQLYTQLKNNDFKHLNDTIEALTFTLEKNGFLKREDKEYIDGRLDK
jgi:exonuclease VII large subunit